MSSQLHFSEIIRQVLSLFLRKYQGIDSYAYILNYKIVEFLSINLCNHLSFFK